MGIVDGGLSVCAAALGGSYTSMHYIAVGQSGLAFSGNRVMLGREFDRNQIDTVDFATPKNVTLIANWSPMDISGCILREHGVVTSGSVFASINTIAGSLVFDGEQELQIQETFVFSRV